MLPHLENTSSKREYTTPVAALFPTGVADHERGVCGSRGQTPVTTGSSTSSC